ncbi:MAG: hypothetical protein CL731_10000 [Chloroflexi bacterium]|nr:hypothetical protein [Chloroflexota bacterium]
MGGAYAALPTPIALALGPQANFKKYRKFNRPLPGSPGTQVDLDRAMGETFFARQSAGRYILFSSQALVKERKSISWAESLLQSNS